MRKKLLPLAVCFLIALLLVIYGYGRRHNTIYTSSDIGLLDLQKEREKKTKPLLGETIAFFGDSITKLGNVIVDNVSQNTGAECINYAFSGCRMSKYLDDVYAHYSMGALANAIYKNDFSEQENALESAGNQKTYYAETLNQLKMIDFESINYICIAYGTNDWNADVPLKSENENDINSFEGALRYTLNVLYDKKPDFKIFVCTPIYRFLWKDGAVSDESDTKKNKIGLKLNDYAESIRRVCAEYNASVIDLYSEMDFNKLTASKYFPNDDGLHPNSLGRALMGKKIAENILNTIK